MQRQIGRVITGEDASGKSFIVRSDRVSAVNIAGVNVFPLWGVPSVPPILPSTGLENPLNEQGTGTVQTAIAVFPPKQLVQGEATEDLHFDEGGFHRTDTVDLAYVISGSIVLSIPGEPDTVLSAGSCVVQNGARHAWRNESDEEATLMFVVTKGQRP